MASRRAASRAGRQNTRDRTRIAAARATPAPVSTRYRCPHCGGDHPAAEHGLDAYNYAPLDIGNLAIIDGGRIVREGTPDRLKAELREREGLTSDPTLDDVFLDATGRTRSKVAGDVQEVSA